MFIAFFVTYYVLRNFITLFCTPLRKKYCILHSKCIICMNPEPTEIDAINVSLQKLFTTCDVIKSGRIKYDEFAGFCRDHNVTKTEIVRLFDKLDMHKDGYNYFSKSSPQLNELIDTLNLAEFRQNQSNQSYLNESEGMKCGELIVSSMEAVPICHLTELAEDIQQQQLSLGAERTREYQEELWNNPSGMEMYLLETQIHKVTQENKLLQSSLMKAKMSIYVLQVELEKLKKEAVDQRLQHEREILQKLKPIPQCKGTHYSLSEKLLDRVGEVTASSSEYDSDDSDDSQDLLDRVWYSRFSVSADVDTPCLNSGGTVSEAAGRRGSITPSTRRLLPAFPLQQEDADGLDSEAPVPVYRLVLAGDAGSGKSSVLLRLGMNEFRGDIQTTLGVDLHMKMMLVDGEKTGLQIWDTAGHERFRSITRSYFCKADGVLLLYDITSESSFRSITEWMAQILESTDKLISMCVIGNKADLRPEHPEGSCVSAAHGEQLAMAYRALFCETSAKEGTNITEAVLHLARELKKKAKS